MLGVLLAGASALGAQDTAATARTDAQQLPDTAPPAVAREFRAAWVATVNNIDWPSKPGLSSFEQQTEIMLILNRAVEINLNAIVLQVRPAGDALYASRLEPWSEYLTGQQGRAPEPYYDPLTFWVNEAHKRGLELHVWLNPYRARLPNGKRAARNHLSRAQPRLVKEYGRHLWMDPGEPAVRRHTLRVIADVVARYDVDGVHMDDYFYPYPERRGGGDTTTVPFPDDASWARYRRNGGKLTRDDWRRSNVDQLIRDMYREVKRIKPWVKVGISPFGIGRPGDPPGILGFDAREKLYADSPKWLENGWADYFSPQLYWPIAQTPQSFPVLLSWWVGHNPKSRHIWPGLFTSRAVPDGRLPPEEIREQIRITRATPGASGNVHFSMKALMGPLVPGLLLPPQSPADSLRIRADSLRRAQLPDSAAASVTVEPIALQLLRNEYTTRALIPAMPWLSRVPPVRPVVRTVLDSATGSTTLRITPAGKSVVRWWVVQLRDSTPAPWRTAILPSAQRSYVLTATDSTPVPAEVRVTAINRVGLESAATVVPRRTPSTP